MPLSTELLPRLEHDFEALNQRIARLAALLGYALVNERSVDEAIHAVSVHLEGDEHASNHNRHLWQEFRGLLVLRYQMQGRSAQAIGAPQLRAVLQHVEDHLARQGIAPDQDGVHLNELFGAAHKPATAVGGPVCKTP